MALEENIQHAMFDAEVVQAIQASHELRVRNAQDKVSSQYSELKRLIKDLWKCQRFEDFIFGRFYIPYSLVNTYIQDIEFPKFVENVQLDSLPNGDILVNIKTTKHGRVQFVFGICDIIVGNGDVKSRIKLKSWKMLDSGWLVRGLVKLGFMTGVDVATLNKVCSPIKFSKVPDANDEYIVDFSEVVKNVLNENHLSMDIVRLINWISQDDKLTLQISISSEKLVDYLKSRMPILFD